MIIHNTNKRKLSKSSYHYKNDFIRNYEQYYKLGGQKRNRVNDELYNKLTNKDPIPINKGLKKPTGRKKKANDYTDSEKLAYYKSRSNNNQLTDKQRNYANRQIKNLKG